MRNFPSRRSRLSMLRNGSSASAKTKNSTLSAQPQSTANEVDSSFEKMSAFAQKELAPADGAVQFVPAYQEAISPATTQPLSSPENSFSMDHESNVFRATHERSTAAVPVTPSPSKSMPKTQTQTQRKPTPTKSVPHSNSNSTNSNSSRASKSETAAKPAKNNTRMGRLASLFTSRAIVKGIPEPEEPVCASPPRSESSSGYVGWPGTQDKRGGTVTMEQSSYEDSDAARSRSDANSSADYHLAASVVQATAAANGPKLQTEAEKVHRLAIPMRGRVQGLGDIYGEGHQTDKVGPLVDPWGMNPVEDNLSDLSTNYSKTSSAYFNAKDVRSVREGQLLGQTYNRKTAASVMRLKDEGPQPPTEEALRLNNHLAPPHKTFNAMNAMGYRGLLDKTRDVPNLMDGTESVSTESTMSNTNHSVRKTRVARGTLDPQDRILEEVSSDVFDGVTRDARNYTLGAAPRNDNENLNLVLLGGGLTTIQTTVNDFSNRRTASDFDDTLSNSDCDDFGYAKIPGFQEMASAGKRAHDKSFGSVTQPYTTPSPRAQEAIARYKYRLEQGSDASGSSLFSDPYQREDWGSNVRGGLQQYYVHPDEMKIIVKKYRKMSSNRSPDLGYDDLEREEDATKAFALSEMRSRIMEKDIERGLERRGGTTVVDDLVLTSFHRTSMRVRDALIVAKAWRDGATPQDVLNTALLTRRPERAYYILRPPSGRNRRLGSRSPDHFPAQRYTWEEVTWVDDLELSQYRCHSVGPRDLHGFEMFTIGDCQSILLKLCNQQCMELREQLNDATARQIDAEDLMKAEGDSGDGMMTESEMIYLSSMEEVKTISHKLVLAEKAFSLVRDRIEKLVAKYEALLVKFENDAESIAPSSVITADSSYYSDYAASFVEEQEREVLARRAQRAELRAELAAREAMLAKQRARELRKQKEDEIHSLRKRLNDLQSETSTAIAEREHSMVLARAITAKSQVSVGHPSATKSSMITSRSKIEDVKQRFRNRSAARKSPNAPTQGGYLSHLSNQQRPQDAASRERSALYRAVGEEMYQHLDFYERSLKSVVPASS